MFIVYLYKTVQRSQIHSSIHLLVKCRLVLCLLPSTTNGFNEIGLGELLAAREVSGRDLRVDLNAGVGRQEVV